MKRNLTYTALATTAAVALLAGTAHAQMAPVVCSTTAISPAKQNCVMPTAAAPGGGSFPGSFLVPGTNTSFAVHGFIQVDVIHDLGPHFGDTAAFTPLVEGNGVTAATAAPHALNGGTTMNAKTPRPNIETRTPTAYGELKTFIEFDFNQTTGTQLAGNNNLLRMRQAFGTLGPWLIGQTTTLYGDAGAYPDTAAGGQDVGIVNTANARRPQVRYTWLAGQGISIAGSVEEPSFPANVVGTVGLNTATAATTVALTGTGAYYNLPRLVAAAQLDRPWGHLRFAIGGGATDIREAKTTTTPSRQVGDFALTLTGHLNTWGKDALRGGIGFNNGAADLTSWVAQGSWAENLTTGTVKLQKAWSVYGSYEHFFNTQWRANGSMGWETVSGNPFTFACTTGAACAAAGLVKNFLTTELNVIYSPVAQTDFFLEWQHAYRKMQSGAQGTANQIDAQFKFYF